MAISISCASRRGKNELQRKRASFETRPSRGAPQDEVDL